MDGRIEGMRMGGSKISPMGVLVLRDVTVNLLLLLLIMMTMMMMMMCYDLMCTQQLARGN